MTTDTKRFTSSPPHHGTLQLLALRWLAAGPTCHLPLAFAIDAAVVAAHLATDGGDVQDLSQELTGWCPDEDDAELIEEAACYLRGEIAAAAVADRNPERP